MSDSVQPQRREPTRLPRPWDSPGKNTGVGCHFLLQCMKVKSESEVAQLCLTRRDPMDCSLPTRLLHPWDFPGKSTEVGCRCLHQQTPYRHLKQICRIIIIFIIVKIRWLSKLRGAVSQGPHPNVIYYLEAQQEWWQDLIFRMFRSKMNPEVMESWLYDCSPALLSLVQITSVQL